jgi:ceramide glucosyltransferase
MGTLSVLAMLLGTASLAGLVYQFAAALLVRRFVGVVRRSPAHRPSVSVLKPLCGDEPHLADNLISVCQQDYPHLQVVCGVADRQDPAVAVVERLQDELSAADFEMVIDGRRHGCNLKVGNLLNMLPAARNEVLVFADSDVHSDQLYLDDVVAPLEDPSVGLVTCLYVGRPDGGLWSRLGALGINNGFLPSALVARALGREDGCFGATMALRRSVLEKVGGLEPLSDVLADDWALGAAVRRAGWRIAVAARPVDLVVHEPNLKSLLAHEVRWGRTIAAVDRPSYLASVITQPVVLALLAALAGGWAYLGLAAAAVLGRWWVVRTEERALGVEKSSLGLLALREVLSIVVFVIAACGRSVLWRGRRFRIRRDGTLELLEGMI